MNAINVLLQQHQQLKIVMENLENAADAENDSCDELFQKFKQVYNLHDRAENDIFYPALQEFPQLEKLVRKGQQAHHVVDVGILELRLVPYDAENWAPKFSVIRDSILIHMEEEEMKLFPKAQELLTQEELMRLGNEINGLT